MEIEKSIRPEVHGFEPYLPGRSLEEVRRVYGLKKIIKLASNENALGTSREVAKSIAKESSQSFRYPDGAGNSLRRELARRLKIDQGEVILGAGSDELIEILAKTFFNRQDEVIVSDHAFIRYRMAADLMGCKTVTVPMKGYQHDLLFMAEKISSATKAIFIANPNNPTGTYVPKGVVKEFLVRVQKKGKDLNSSPFIVFDEAYYEYAREMARDYPETLDDFTRGNNLVILRTFSKAYGLAGLRLGYGIARKEIVSQLDRVRPPFNVSALAQVAGLSALRDRAHLRRSVGYVKKEIKNLEKSCKSLGLEVVPSVGNFLLLNVYPPPGKRNFREASGKRGYRASHG